MNEEETTVLNLFKDKIEEAMQHVPSLSTSSQSSGLQLWVNALQAGNDVQFNLCTSENGLLHITLVEPNESRQSNESTDATDLTESDPSPESTNESATISIDDKTLDKGEEWGLFRIEKGGIVAHPINEVLENTDCKWTNVNQPSLEMRGLFDEDRNSNIITGTSGCFLFGQGISNLPIDASSIVQDKDTIKVELSNTENTVFWTADDATENKPPIIISITTDENGLQPLEDKYIPKPTPADPSCFPCVRSDWYIRPPQNPDKALVDETCNINTSAVASDLRLFLKHKSISLGNFSQNYLQRTQGTLSDLLNHPKPWSGLSARGRSIYLKMMQFLNAKNLEDVVSELKEAYQTVRPGRPIDILPSDMMDMLKRGEMPSDDLLQSLALQFKVDEAYLQAYCQTYFEDDNATTEDEKKQEEEKEAPKLDNLLTKPDGTEVSENLSRMTYPDQLTTSPTANLKTMKLQHGFQPRYSDKQICPVYGCGIILKNKPSLGNHLLTHSGERPYKCSKCEKQFATLSNLKCHERRHDNQPKISKRARTVASLRKTSVKDANEASPESQVDAEPFVFPETTERSTEVKLQTMKYSYACGVCARRFATRRLLHNHITAWHSAAKMRDKNRHFTCHMCSKSLKTMTSLVVHLRTHSGDRPYQCIHCDKHFLTKANCIRHAKTHSGAKPYKCPSCSARFTEAGSVDKHMRIHTGEKPFPCETCGKRFSQHGPLIAHRLLHTGTRPYLCEICGRSFRQKTNLRSHEDRHLGIRKHSCHVCAHAFQYKNDLQRHLLKHSGDRSFICNICTLSFTRLQYLKSHVHKVHDLAPFKCEQCGSGFSTKSALEQHQIVESETHLNQQNSSKLITDADSNIQSLSETHSNGVEYDSSILQVGLLSDTMCCIAPISPTDTGVPAMQQSPSIANVIPDDIDPALSESTTSFAISADDNVQMPVAIVTDRDDVYHVTNRIVFTSRNGIGDISKLPEGETDPCSAVVSDGSDPNMQSVIVASEDCDDIHGTRYVVVSVGDDVTAIASENNQQMTLENDDV